MPIKKPKSALCYLLYLPFFSITTNAIAQDQNSDDPQHIENDQVNLAEVIAEINAELYNISQDAQDVADEAESAVSMTSAGMGNSFSTASAGTTRVDNSQNVTENVVSGLKLSTPDGISVGVDANDMLNIEGRVIATSAAIGNSASVTIEDATNGRGAVSAIANDQDTNYAEFYSRLNIVAPGLNFINAGGVALEATSASIANSFNAKVNGNANNGELIIDTRQVFEGNSISDLDVDIANVTGDVNLTSVAMANSASIETGGIANVDVKNCQTTDASVCIRNPELPAPPPPPRPVDPSSYADIYIDSVDGDFALTNAAISNSFSLASSTLPRQTNIDTQQYNTALTEALANIEIGQSTGKIDITSVAIGNSVDIKTLTGGF